MSTKVQGSLRGDQLTVATLSIDKLKGQSLKVLAGFTDSSTGQTHGYMDDSNVTWSAETAAALEELLGCVERDLVRAHFEDEDGRATPDTGNPTLVANEQGLNVPPTGLREHVGTSGPDSI